MTGCSAGGHFTSNSCGELVAIVITGILSDGSHSFHVCCKDQNIPCEELSTC